VVGGAVGVAVEAGGVGCPGEEVGFGRGHGVIIKKCFAGCKAFVGIWGGCLLFDGRGRFLAVAACRRGEGGWQCWVVGVDERALAGLAAPLQSRLVCYAIGISTLWSVAHCWASS
jgi:hypothetical protein